MAVEEERMHACPRMKPSSGRLGLPYAHLNLRYNPFGDLDRKQIAKLAVADVAGFVRKLKQPGFAVQFIGDKGRGKTTHLLAIHRCFPNAPYIHINEGERPEIPEGHPLFIDEIQRLSRFRRNRIFHRPVSFVLGTHIDYSEELTKAGMAVETVRPENSAREFRLFSIFGRRIERARRSPGPVPRIRPPEIRKLMKRFGNDIRGMENYLYDVFQSLKEVRDVQM